MRVFLKFPVEVLVAVIPKALAQGLLKTGVSSYFEIPVQAIPEIQTWVMHEGSGQAFKWAARLEPLVSVSYAVRARRAEKKSRRQGKFDVLSDDSLRASSNGDIADNITSAPEGRKEEAARRANANH